MKWEAKKQTNRDTQRGRERTQGRKTGRVKEGDGNPVGWVLEVFICYLAPILQDSLRL